MGKLRSNQLQYSQLVSVLCSFEETYANAFTLGPDGRILLTRRDLSNPTPELALIHTNALGLTGSVSRSFALGYTYVYTTDRLLNANIGGGLPPYFTTDVGLTSNLQP